WEIKFLAIGFLCRISLVNDVLSLPCSTCQHVGKKAVARLLSFLLSCHVTCVNAPELGRLAPARAEKAWRLVPIVALKEGRCACAIALGQGCAAPGLTPVCGCLAHGNANIVRTFIFASFEPTSSPLINKP
ncbi:hypothetical protein HAX54_051181, partial [Datura stramonium]|nr:hypothetical protein [Datura stramonium]